MLRFAILSLAVLGAVSADSCYDDVELGCSAGNKLELPLCNAIYGAFDVVSGEMKAYANLHLRRSYEFLLSSAYFDNYETNREGFSKLFRKLSDDAWQKSIGLIQHITKRGGVMDFNALSNVEHKEKGNRTVEVYEVGSLARALDTHKELAERAFHIHREATRHRDDLHDAELAHYLEEEFMESHAETIRSLAGHTNDLKTFIKDQRGQDLSLALYLFDEYLKKV